MAIILKIKTVYLPEADLAELDRLVKEKHYGNVSEAIRAAVRDLIRYHREAEKLERARSRG